MEIEAAAKRRLADKCDAAQERGEVATGRPKNLPDGKTFTATADLGLTSRQVHEARQIRNAEAVLPGIVCRTLDQPLAQGKEPTKAAVREAVANAIAPQDADQSNVVQLGNRRKMIPSPKAIKRVSRNTSSRSA